MHVEHLRHQPADAAKADDHRLLRARFGRRLILVLAAFRFQSGTRHAEQWCQRQRQGGDGQRPLQDLPAKQAGGGGGTQHDQAGFRRTGQHQCDMASNAAARPLHAQQDIGGDALDRQHGRSAAQHRPRIAGDGAQIEPATHPDQEHTEQQAFEWQDRGFDLPAIIAG